MNRIAQIFLTILVIVIWQFASSANITAKSLRTSKIPEIYKPFLSGIGSIRTRNYRCTAFCVGRDVIATSQHCLQKTNERWRSSSLNFQFEAEYEGRMYKTSVFGETSKERKLNIAFGLTRSRGYSVKSYKRKPGTYPSDWALIKLKSKICRTILPLKHLISLPVRTLPGSQHAAMISAERFKQRSKRKRWTYSGQCRFLRTDVFLGKGRVAHDCRAIPGTSGSPIFLKDEEGNLVVVAINSALTIYKNIWTNGKEVKVNTAITTGVFADALPHFVAHDRITETDKIIEIQDALKKQGDLKGKLDGVFGPETRFAIVSFENSIGLPELGLPTVLIYELLKKLRAVPYICTKSPRVKPAECKKIGLDSKK